MQSNKFRSESRSSRYLLCLSAFFQCCTYSIESSGGSQSIKRNRKWWFAIRLHLCCMQSQADNTSQRYPKDAHSNTERPRCCWRLRCPSPKAKISARWRLCMRRDTPPCFPTCDLAWWYSAPTRRWHYSTHAYTHGHTHGQTYTHTCTYIHIHAHKHTHAHSRGYTDAHTDTCIHIHAHISIHECIMQCMPRRQHRVTCAGEQCPVCVDVERCFSNIHTAEWKIQELCLLLKSTSPMVCMQWPHIKLLWTSTVGAVRMHAGCELKRITWRDDPTARGLGEADRRGWTGIPSHRACHSTSLQSTRMHDA